MVKEEPREGKRGRKRIGERKVGDTGFSNHCENRRNCLEEVREKVGFMRFFDRRGMDEEDSFQIYFSCCVESDRK